MLMKRLLTACLRSLSRGRDETVHDLVPCRDGHGRRARIAVRVLPGRNVGVELPVPGPVSVRPLDVGRLRWALRSAATSSDSPARTHRDRRASQGS